MMNKNKFIKVNTLVSLSLSLPPSPSPSLSGSLSPKIGKLVYFTLLKSQATTGNLVTASIFCFKF
jgi:hypothetical protein